MHDASANALQGPITEYPRPSSPPSLSSSGFLSSPPSNVEQYHDLLNRASERLDQYEPVAKSDDTANLLRIVLKHLPKDGRINLSLDILSLEDDSLLRQLRDHFVDAILKPMKATGGKTPAVTPSSSIHSPDDVLIQQTQVQPSSRRDQPWLKSHCLERDGYCCVMTGYVDLKHRNKYPRGMRVEKTECAHILPFSLGDFNGKEPREVENKSIIWAAIFRYFPALEGLISAETINCLENAFTLTKSLHDYFGEFIFTLEQTDKPHTYRPIWYEEDLGSSVNCPDVVTLTSRNPSLPLPSPALLQAHCAIAKILDVSGIGREISIAIYDAAMEPDIFIRPDGSTDLASIILRRLLMQV